MRSISRIAATAVVGATTVALTAGQASAAARTPSASDSVVYGVASAATVPTRAASSSWQGIAHTYDYPGYGGKAVGATGEQWDLLTAQSGGTTMNDRISSLQNYSNADICFYADRGFGGRYVWLKRGAEIKSLANGNWIDNQISSFRAAPAFQKC